MRSVLGAFPSRHRNRRGRKLPSTSLIGFLLEWVAVLTSLLISNVGLSTGSEAYSGSECQGVALGTKSILILFLTKKLLLHHTLVRAQPGACRVDLSTQVWKTEHFTGALRNNRCLF